MIAAVRLPAYIGGMPEPKTSPPTQPPAEAPPDKAITPVAGKVSPAEIGGPKGPEPTRFGDWERNGRCIDF